jgi:protein ImuA
MASPRNGVSADLRACIARIERGGAAAEAYGVLPFGAPLIDGALPDGGLAIGAVHEVTGSAASGFAAMIAGKLGGAVLWCLKAASRAALYGPGLAAFGLDTRRLVIADCASQADMLWAMEEGLRDPALAAVIGEPDRPVALAASRRLQLAAETGGVTGLVLRRGGQADTLAPSAIFSRWRADSVPVLGLTDAPFSGARWTLELLRCRGGLAAAGRTWMVDWCDATRDISVVSELGDRPAETGSPEYQRVG